MHKNLYWGLGIGLLTFLTSSRAIADSMVAFDFDALNSKVYRSKNFKSVETYMESLYGEDISVSKGTVAFKGSLTPTGNLPASYAGQPGNTGGMYLRNSGNKPLTLDFGVNGISSFSIDWKLFKNGKGLTILADGVVIDQQTLLKSQKKTGATGNLTLFFDSSVHQLQFVGAKNTRFGLDNLVTNLPNTNSGGSGGSGTSEIGDGPNLPNENYSGDGTNEGPNGPEELSIALENITPIITTTESVPEPASLLMLALGVCAVWGSRRCAVG